MNQAVASRAAAGLWAAVALMASLASPAAANSAQAAVPKVRAVLQTGVGRGEILAAAWMPDSKHFITASDTGIIVFWDAATGKILDRLGQSNCQIRVNPSTGHVVPRPGPTNCIIPEIKPAPEDAQNYIQTRSLSVSPDGRFAVMVGEDPSIGDTEIEVYDTATRQVAGWLHRRPVAWAAGKADARLIVDPAEGCAPGKCERSVIDLATLEGPYLSEAPATGVTLGQRVSADGPVEAVSPDGAKVVSADGWLRPTKTGRGLAVPLTGFDTIDIPHPEFSPDGRRFAFAMSLPSKDHRGRVDETPGAWVFDLERGRLFQAYRFRVAAAKLAPASGGSIEGWISNGRLALIDADGQTPLAVDINTGATQTLSADPKLVSPYDPASAAQSSCKLPERQDGDVVLSGCYRWTWQEDGTLVFNSARDGRELFRLLFHPDGTWVALDPANRYDTNGSVESSDLRWILPAQPWRSLPVQTFMRDYYQPGLMGKLLDWNASPKSISPFRLPPDPSTLNLALPIVTIVGVAPGASAGTVSVRVKAVEGEDPTAPPERSRSGLYDLRLFRDGKLVSQIPPSKPQAADGPQGFRFDNWQADTGVPSAPDGIYGFNNIAVPSHAAGRPVVFTAYAFNSSRVKGETSDPFPYRLVEPVARTRYAYVIAIGADDYPALPDHALHFAVSDAKAIRGSLKAFLDAEGAGSTQPYVVVPITLVSNFTAEQAHKADVRAVFDILAGKEDHADVTAITEHAVDVTGLHKATPDDLVLIAFAGHGWATPLGDFYLLPSDARLPDEKDPDSLATLISSAELADWLRGVDAGEMAMVIDACHSAASVAAAGFKPGPMGDPGLGQLAYDKGIRILAATQGDDVAQESASLGGGHGLLTYVLVDKALGDPKAGGAERDAGDGVRIDSLLNFVVDRMPAESARLLVAPPPWLANANWKPMLAPRSPPPPEPPHLQQPALFDFTGTHSSAAVRPPENGGL